MTRRQILAGVPGVAAGSRLFAASIRATHTPDKLAAALQGPGDWKPFPRHADRSAWDAVLPDTRERLIAAAAARMSEPWPALSATQFLEFVREGNRSKYEAVRGVRRDLLRALVVAECLEGKGRFADAIANGIWTTCEESFWGLPAHMSPQKAGPGLPDPAEQIVDLFAAETASQLAWTEYLMAPLLDRVSPQICRRIRMDIDRNVLKPCMERDFAWMGFYQGGRPPNNWNPWINSNWLTSVLLIEQDAQRRGKAVARIMDSLDKFLAGYHPDGGCDEGPGYWGRAGASLFDCLDLLYSASNGAIDYFRDPLIREMGRYIYRAHIAGGWFINFADASARTHPEGDLVYRYGKRIADPDMQAFGAHFANPPDGGTLPRQLHAIFNWSELKAAPKRLPQVRDVWMPGIQVMAARTKAGTSDGLYLAAQGGHNAESHNHNDVGNFIVFADGEPAIIDIGVETYSAKTFSSRRYEIWTMQSAYHNVPTIRGVMQKAGREFEARQVAYKAADASAEISMDIAAAYPAEAGVKQWMRTLRLDRQANQIVIADRCRLGSAGPVMFTLMTARPAREKAAGVVEIALKRPLELLYDPRLKAKIEEIRVEDRRLRGSWGDTVYRIVLEGEAAAESEFAARLRQV